MPAGSGGMRPVMAEPRKLRCGFVFAPDFAYICNVRTAYGNFCGRFAVPGRGCGRKKT